MFINLVIVDVDECHFPEPLKSGTEDDDLEDILEVDEDVSSPEKSVIVVTEQPDPAVQGKSFYK